MSKQTAVQIIKNKGRPEWAVIPYQYYLYLHELQELSEDIADFRKALRDQQEELIPEKFAKRLVAGGNPIRVWREYRNITQKALAKVINISAPYLSQLEHGERTASMTVLKKIAQALNLTLDDLVYNLE